MRPPSEYELLHSNELPSGRLAEVRQYLNEMRDRRKVRLFELRIQGRTNKTQDVLLRTLEEYIKSCKQQ